MRFSTRNNNKQALRRQKMYNMLSNKLKKIVEKETSTAEETDEIIAINPQLEAKLKKLVRWRMKSGPNILKPKEI